MVKIVTMLMSSKMLSRGRSLLKLVVWKGNRKKKQSSNHITALKQTPRRIHNLMKYQNQNHLQKQLTALSHQLFTQKKKKSPQIFNWALNTPPKL